MDDKPYVPEGKDITTKNGCTCKSEYKTESGEVFRNACNVVDATDPWCTVEGRCGQVVAKGKLKGEWWDKCTASSQEPEEVIHGKGYFSRNLVGIIIYVIVFVIAIPVSLYKNGAYELLEVYMPNFDLLATAVSFGGGPADTRIFQELYNQESNNLMGQISTLIINYLSLLGLTYLVARRVNITKSLAKGWGIGFVMILLTYLVPNDIISAVQHKFASGVLGIKFGEGKTLSEYLSVVSVGLGIAGMFILVEIIILKNHKTLIDPFVKKILQFDDFFDKLFNI